MNKSTNNSISKIVQNTQRNMGMVNNQKKKDYARNAAGFNGWISAILGSFKSKNFSVMIEGKSLIKEEQSNTQG